MSTTNKIDADINELEEILATDKNLYQIPEYQRPYQWNRDNLGELIDDLVTAYTEAPEEDYFCGSLVLVENASAKRYDVVDGQQRLTTFVILACVLRDVYGDKLSGKAKANVNESIKKRHDADEKLRLHTDVLHQTDFHEMVIQRVDFDKPVKGNRYLENAHTLKELLNDKFGDSPASVAEFVQWMYQKVLLTKITCSTEDGAIRIFDVLNSRGIPLTAVDILKARLMRRCPSQEKRVAFNASWNSIDQRLEDANFSMEEMLNTYLYYKKAPNSKVRLDKALDEVFKEENLDSLAVVSELGQFSKSYIEVLEEASKHRYCLQYLNHQIYWVSILVTAKFTDYQPVNDLKSALVAYFYQNWIAGSYVTRIKQTSLNVLKDVKAGKPIESVKVNMQKNLAEYDTTIQFRKELNGNRVYDRKWARALLLLLNYFSTDDSDTAQFVPLHKGLHIEHILPQTPSDEWKEIFNDEQIENWTHALANLTLLSGKKDSQASNRPFAYKKQVYLDMDGVASAFFITQEVGRRDKWDEHELKKRHDCLLGKLKKKLDIFESPATLIADHAG